MSKVKNSKKLLTKLLKANYNNNCYKNTYASLAQLVEQQTLNLMVGGSTPL